MTKAELKEKVEELKKHLDQCERDGNAVKAQYALDMLVNSIDEG